MDCATCRGCDGVRPRIATSQSAEADCAIALLRQAVAAGYRDWGYIKGERAFDVLRDREDFKKVVSDLERPQEKAKP